MIEDILNYSPTVMFRGTPCMPYGKFPLGKFHIGKVSTWEIVTWEKAFVKVPLTLHILLDKHIVHIDIDCFENLHQFSRLGQL